MSQYQLITNGQLGSFKMKGYALRYSSFVPRLYNLTKSLGFTPNKIMPSRAFCSDESQGFPIILIAKHFGAFPFNHGRVGGMIALDRHGPHAHHGLDMVIIHASHVGYDKDSQQYGVYRRLQTEPACNTSNCGKIDGVLTWYLQQYEYAKTHVFISKQAYNYSIIIDNERK